MFFTYLRRELRGRMRQAVFIALGLALGIGLVITVTAAATGVKNAQGTVLKSLYGVGTDATVTKTPTAGSFTPGSFGFGFADRHHEAARGRHQDRHQYPQRHRHAGLNACNIGDHRGRPERRGGSGGRADSE